MYMYIKSDFILIENTCVRVVITYHIQYLIILTELGSLSICCIFLGVVVIDEVPEVTNDDPAFLFEQNDGFQEVTSKRTIRSKQKAQQEIELMKQKELSKKSVSKVLILHAITISLIEFYTKKKPSLPNEE